jgi:uncharacterized membrane protein
VKESDREVETTGWYLFAGASALFALCKIMGVNDWSWWRVCLPFAGYLGFNLIYMVTGLAYLSWIDFVRTDGTTEKVRIAADEKRGYLRLGAIHFTLFAVGVSEWASPSEAWSGFWGSFGSAGVMITFASLTIVSLILFWSTNVQCRSEPSSTR